MSKLEMSFIKHFLNKEDTPKENIEASKRVDIIVRSRSKFVLRFVKTKNCRQDESKT